MPSDIYPAAEQVPWKWQSADGPTYYKGLCIPTAVVLHRMQGNIRTARQWAKEGHYGASWHFTVGLDGTVLQHLRREDGGYHAGIGSTAPAPTWPLWEGHGRNVNFYTVGIECEGFVNGEWPEAQLEALYLLTWWISKAWNIPHDRDHYPPHADIDIVNRVNDFDTPERRHIVYDYLFRKGDDSMTDAEREELKALRRIVGGQRADDYDLLVLHENLNASVLRLQEQVATLTALHAPHQHNPGG